MKKNSQIRTLIKTLLAKCRFLKKLSKILFEKNRNFSGIIVIFLDQLLLPYKIHGSSMRGILFFDFASCEPLKNVKKYQNFGTRNLMNLSPPAKTGDPPCFLGGSNNIRQAQI